MYVSNKHCELSIPCYLVRVHSIYSKAQNEKAHRPKPHCCIGANELTAHEREKKEHGYGHTYTQCMNRTY